MIGVILQTSAFSAVQMIIGRILLGMGNGTISALVPAFVQESAVGSEKGRSQDILITVGYGVLGIAVANCRCWTSRKVFIRACLGSSALGTCLGNRSFGSFPIQAVTDSPVI